MLKNIHHIAYIVKDFDAAISFFQKACGMPIRDLHYMEKEDQEILFFEVGGTYIEIIKPASKESPINRLIEHQGEGFFHIAFEVEDIEKAMTTLKAGKVKIINEKPLRGFNWRLVNLDRADTLGVHTQIVEPIWELSKKQVQAD
ncbi:MAG: VOC family protein [Nitrososphaerota archaeon]